jgi:hypothetical protein
MAGFVPLCMLANRGVEQQDRRVKGKIAFHDCGSRVREQNSALRGIRHHPILTASSHWRPPENLATWKLIVKAPE